MTGGVVLNWLDQISQECVFFPSIDLTDTSGAQGKLTLFVSLGAFIASDKFQGLPEHFNRSSLDLTCSWPHKALTKTAGMKQYSTFQGLKAIRGNFTLYFMSLEGRNHGIVISTIQPNLG